jgi:hypothetical protein
MSTVIQWAGRYVLAGKLNEKIGNLVAYTLKVPTSRGVVGGRERCDVSWRQRPRGGKFNVLYNNAIFFAQNLNY